MTAQAGLADPLMDEMAADFLTRTSHEAIVPVWLSRRRLRRRRA